MTTTLGPSQLDEARSLEQKHHIQVYKRYPLTLVEGRGVYVKDATGKSYLDALAGIAVNSLGHCHPAVVRAIQDQAETLLHVSNFFYNAPMGRLAALLTEVSGMDRVFFCNSGTEAVEGALKLARKYAHAQGKKGDIVAMEKCFHGRSLAAIAMGKEKYQRGFAPLPEGFLRIPFGDPESFRRTVSERDVIAVILEPVQGEGGIHVAGDEYLREMRSICDAEGILLIADEIQCGLGRTGKMFAFQHSGIVPDIVTCAKALGGGVPIGALLARENVAAAFDFGDHGTTYGGNPLACAAAYATLKTLVDENFADQARHKGEYALAKLAEIARDWDAIREVRGRGLMIGVELSFEGAQVVMHMLEKGVIANCTEGNVIRLVPPLVIQKQELDRVIEVLVEAIRKVESNG